MLIKKADTAVYLLRQKKHDSGATITWGECLTQPTVTFGKTGDECTLNLHCKLLRINTAVPCEVTGLLHDVQTLVWNASRLPICKTIVPYQSFEPARAYVLRTTGCYCSPLFTKEDADNQFLFDVYMRLMQSSVHGHGIKPACLISESVKHPGRFGFRIMASRGAKPHKVHDPDDGFADLIDFGNEVETFMVQEGCTKVQLPKEVVQVGKHFPYTTYVPAFDYTDADFVTFVTMCTKYIVSFEAESGCFTVKLHGETPNVVSIRREKDKCVIDTCTHHRNACRYVAEVCNAWLFGNELD